MILIQSACAEELPWALNLVFGHLEETDRQARIANALSLVASGELDPAGILLAREGKELVGVQVCIPLAGAGSLFWLPAVLDSCDFQDHLKDRLLQEGLGWVRKRGAKLAQALLPPSDSSLIQPLIRNGFAKTTELLYLCHDLQGDIPSSPVTVQLEPFKEDNQAQFKQTMLRTYENTLDCPELNGVRTIEEIIEGHKAQGIFHPGRWWLAREAGQAVGVLLTTRVPEGPVWDLSYLGLIPQARGRGLGQALTLHALKSAREDFADQLILSVDVRNRPALRLYQALGFEARETREVYLCLF